MKNTAFLKIGISGKREIAPEERDRVYKEISNEIRRMLRHNKCDEFTGFSSLASGADTLFAAVVVNEFKQPLHVILPFPREEYEKDFDEEDLGVFRTRLGQAAQCDIAAATPVEDRERSEAYFEAGKMIVDQCDEMVIVWDELRPGGIGGTAEMIGYLAEKKKRYPVSYIKVKAHKADLLHEALIHGYYRANGHAIKARNKYRLVWKWVILLGWLTVGIFAVKTAFGLEGSWERFLTLLEFLFVLTVYVLIFLARKRDFHGNYLRERMKAETYRLMRTFYHAGVEIGIADRTRGEEEANLAEMAGNINRRLDAEPMRSKWYTQYVIKLLLNEQCGYHKQKVTSIGDQNHFFERVNLVVGILFIVNLTVHLVQLFLVDDPKGTLLHECNIFFNILLPASYAALEGIIYFNEWAALKKYSTSAGTSLEEARELLPEHLEQAAEEESYRTQAQVLHLVSGIMLTDNRNWNLILENKGNYHMMV